MNSTSHTNPPAIGPHRLWSLAVTKHRHCATNVKRLRNPSKNCFTLLLNRREPTGDAPSAPGDNTNGSTGFLFLSASVESVESTAFGFTSPSSILQLVSEFFESPFASSTIASTASKTSSVTESSNLGAVLFVSFFSTFFGLFITASNSFSSIGIIFCFPVILSRSTLNARMVCF